jgi:DNA-binding FadR family transcriptional regulator
LAQLQGQEQFDKVAKLTQKLVDNDKGFMSLTSDQLVALNEQRANLKPDVWESAMKKVAKDAEIDFDMGAMLEKQGFESKEAFETALKTGTGDDAQKAMEAMQSIQQTLMKQAKEKADPIVALREMLKKFAQAIREEFKDLIPAIKELIPIITDMVKTHGPAMVNHLKNILAAVNSVLQWLIDPKKFAEDSARKGREKIAENLKKGEYVSAAGNTLKYGSAATIGSMGAVGQSAISNVSEGTLLENTVRGGKVIGNFFLKGLKVGLHKAGVRNLRESDLAPPDLQEGKTDTGAGGVVRLHEGETVLPPGYSFAEGSEGGVVKDIQALLRDAYMQGTTGVQTGQMAKMVKAVQEGALSKDQAKEAGSLASAGAMKIFQGVGHEGDDQSKMQKTMETTEKILDVGRKVIGGIQKFFGIGGKGGAGGAGGDAGTITGKEFNDKKLKDAERIRQQMRDSFKAGTIPQMLGAFDPNLAKGAKAEAGDPLCQCIREAFREKDEEKIKTLPAMLGALAPNIVKEALSSPAVKSLAEMAKSAEEMSTTSAEHIAKAMGIDIGAYDKGAASEAIAEGDQSKTERAMAYHRLIQSDLQKAYPERFGGAGGGVSSNTMDYRDQMKGEVSTAGGGPAALQQLVEMSKMVGPQAAAAAATGGAPVDLALIQELLAKIAGNTEYEEGGSSVIHAEGEDNPEQYKAGGARANSHQFDYGNLAFNKEPEAFFGVNSGGRR